MYNQIKKIPNISPYNIHCGVRCIFCIDTISKNILCIDINSFNIKWKSHRKDYSFVVINENIVSNNFTIYNLKGKLLYQKEDIKEWYQLELANRKQNIVLYKTVDEEKEQVFYHLFNVKSKKNIYENIKDSFSSYMANIIVDFSKIVFTNFDFVALININSKIPFLWKKDIREITSYTEWDNTEEEGEIRKIYAFENSILVLTQVFILRIDTQTGNIIYSLRLPAGLMSLSIEGKKAYGCYGYHYMEIDIEKGKLLNFVRIETVFYKEKEYSAIMSMGTYHNGFVFHELRIEGGQYAIGAINIRTAKREWVDLLGVFMIENIQFHQDKMFVSDSGSNLFIYEEE